ncbi:MAG TPA: DUF2235 domain-containing protein, partial [Burkholderiaceae bacterium]
MSAQAEDKLDPDGIQNDGVSTYPADAQRLQTYADAEQKLAQFQAPVFIHADNPHERLYVAAFDGTGNDKDKDPQHETNVGKIYDQINRRNSDPRIRGGYVAGPGTEDGWLARTYDGATGHTYEPRLEAMYKQFIEQASDWKNEDPQADIRLAETGFSRGASQAAGFARMVHERGIQDPAGAEYTKDADGRITGVQYTKPPLVAPGQVAQAEMLFDPVSTGEPMKHDRRPPPSVVSGMQIIAEDEKRPAFPSDHIIRPGQTPDGRFLGVTVAGAHSDVGGSYHRDGLAARSENLAINYLNALSDKPFLTNVAEPADPRLNVVHRSEEGFPFNIDPRHHINRDTAQGYNEREVPQDIHITQERIGRDTVSVATYTEKPGVSDAFHAEPRDEKLNQQFNWQTVQTGQPSQPGEPGNPIAKNGAIDGVNPNGYLQNQGGAGTLTLATASALPVDASRKETTDHLLAALLSDDPAVMHAGVEAGLNTHASQQLL